MNTIDPDSTLALDLPALARTPKRAARPAGTLRVFDHLFDDADLDLMRDGITNEYERTRGSSVASLNIGGWKSGELFGNLRASENLFSQLGNVILSLTGLAHLAGWAMINMNGSAHPRHYHQGAVMTGVFYVTVGDETQVTPTTFETPGAEWGETLEIDPAPGRLLVFPGWLWHAVPPVAGDVPRISIAFDAKR